MRARPSHSVRHTWRWRVVRRTVFAARRFFGKPWALEAAAQTSQGLPRRSLGAPGEREKTAAGQGRHCAPTLVAATGEAGSGGRASGGELSLADATAVTPHGPGPAAETQTLTAARLAWMLPDFLRGGLVGAPWGARRQAPLRGAEGLRSSSGVWGSPVEGFLLGVVRILCAGHGWALAGPPADFQAVSRGYYHGISSGRPFAVPSAGETREALRSRSVRWLAGPGPARGRFLAQRRARGRWRGVSVGRDSVRGGIMLVT